MLYGYSCFNPRTRKGCDIIQDHYCKFIVVSTHAPVKDATQLSITQSCEKSFNPRTRKGCDWLTCIEDETGTLFQPTHP